MDKYRKAKQQIEEAAPGTIFVVNDMGVDVFSAGLALKDKVRAGEVKFVAPNIFRKPKISSFLNMEVPVSPDEVVPILARINGWTVIPSEYHCQNMLGLSTQVPAHYNYTSTGPDTVIQIGGHIVIFEHCGERYMTELSGRARLLIHAMSGEVLFDCTDAWESAKRVLLDTDKEQLREHMDCVPEWMKPEICKLLEGTNNV